MGKCRKPAHRGSPTQARTRVPTPSQQTMYREPAAFRVPRRGCVICCVCRELGRGPSRRTAGRSGSGPPLRGSRQGEGAPTRTGKVLEVREMVHEPDRVPGREWARGRLQAGDRLLVGPDLLLQLLDRVPELELGADQVV